MPRSITKYLLFFCLIFFAGFSTISFAEASKNPLPLDQAFVLMVSVEDTHKAMVQWRIAPGYYLYRQRAQITLQPQLPAEIRFPQGVLKYDAYFGRQEVYFNHLDVPILLQATAEKVQLNIEYQGCSESGFCYPPTHKTILLNLANQSVTSLDSKNSFSAQGFSWRSLLTHQQEVQFLLQNQPLSLLFIIFVGLGLLLAFTPCVLPMIPILTSIIVGQHTMNARKAFFLSFIYVLGSATTYAIAGLVAARMGSSLQVIFQQPWIIALTSGLFILLAISLFGYFDLRLPAGWQNRLMFWSQKQRSGSYMGVFFMGVLSTLIVSPCVTAPLIGVLIYISQTYNTF